MCFAIPGKIIEVDENKFVVDYGSEKRIVNMSLVDVDVGDYVVVSNKIIITKVSKEEAIKFLDIIKNKA